jgi:hypothetical protein
MKRVGETGWLVLVLGAFLTTPGPMAATEPSSAEAREGAFLHAVLALRANEPAALLAPGESLGTVAQDGVEMPVVDAVAVWDAERPRLRIYLFPFELTPEDVELCRSDDSSKIQRESPDPAKWPHRYPTAAYTLDWWSSEGVGDPRRAQVGVRTQDIAVHNQSVEAGVMMEFADEGIEQTLEGELETGARIHLRARGEQEVGEHTVSWDLDIRAEVLSASG